MAVHDKRATDGTVACDAHQMGLDAGECPGDAGHCALGQHCTHTTASCAAEMSGDDHPNRCCACQEELD